MSDIKTLPLEKAQEKLKTRSDELRTILNQAELPDGSYDASKVTVPGVDLKSSADLIAEVKKRNAELDEIADHVVGLQTIKNAAETLDRYGKARSGFLHPGAPGQGGQPANLAQFKSIGDQVTESKAFKDWHARGCPDGFDFKLEDMLGSDYLAKTAQFETIGRKALMSTNAGFAPESLRLPGFTDAVTRPIQLLDILPMGRTTQQAVPFMVETTRTHAAAETAEGAAFPESTFAFIQNSAPVVKIGDSLPVTDEQLEDVALVESYINGRLGFGVRQRLDQQALIGTGTGVNLRGILNVSGIQTQAKGADPVMDAIYKAIVNIMLVGRAVATHIVMHPRDFQNIRLMRTADGLYICGNPQDAGPMRLWGLPIVMNDALTQGTALIGAFDPAWIMLFERRGIDIQMGYVGTQFTQGLRTMRADMRAALAVFRPAAFCTATGL
jgi:HK97 family phage major capsid protein